MIFIQSFLINHQLVGYNEKSKMKEFDIMYRKRTSEYANLRIERIERDNDKIMIVNNGDNEIIACKCDKVSICIRQNKLLKFLTKPYIILENRFTYRKYISKNVHKPIDPKFKPVKIVGFMPLGNGNIFEFISEVITDNLYDWIPIREKLGDNPEVVYQKEYQ